MVVAPIGWSVEGAQTAPGLEARLHPAPARGLGAAGPDPRSVPSDIAILRGVAVAAVRPPRPASVENGLHLAERPNIRVQGRGEDNAAHPVPAVPAGGRIMRRRRASPAGRGRSGGACRKRAQSAVGAPSAAGGWRCGRGLAGRPGLFFAGGGDPPPPMIILPPYDPLWDQSRDPYGIRAVIPYGIRAVIPYGIRAVIPMGSEP